MTRAERAEAKQTAIAIAADVERKAQQRKAARKQQRLVETPKTLTTSTPVEVQRFATVEDYFAAGNPNPLSHRRGLPNYKRDVSERTKKEVKKRDGNCCLVCGSTYKLQVDHRIGLQNGGSNEIGNLGTLCKACHVKKTRLDNSIRRKRDKEAGLR